jgi:hypothetical protein
VDSIPYVGSISSGDVGAIRQVLAAWSGLELTFKAKLSGEQIHGERDGASLYCYREFSLQPGREAFLIEGRMACGLEDAKARLTDLVKRFQARGIVADFDEPEPG